MWTIVRRVLFVVAALLAIWTFWWEPRSLTARDVELRLACWNAPPLRIAIIGDLHAGAPYIGEAKVNRVVDLVNAKRPDVIVLLGDFVVQGVLGGHFVPPEETAAQLARLRARLGVFAITGNHDGWLGAERVEKALRANGIHVIDDDAVRVADFWIVGISDLWTGRHDVAGAVAKVDDDAPAIAITHNPDVFPQVPRRICLTLAAHTHGGQVAFPLVGRLVVPSRFGQRYAAGHVAESGHDLFVTTGVGTSIIPARFRVPPEVVLLRILR